MARGSIRKRHDSKGKLSYQITLDLDRDPVTGKRQRRYKTIYGSMKQAEAELQKMLNSANDDSACLQSSMRLRDWMAIWLRDHCENIETTTLDGYTASTKNHILPALGNIPLNQLNMLHIQRFVNALYAKGNGLSAKTVRNTYVILNKALKKAMIANMIPSNPCYGVDLPKLDPFTPQVYNQAEVRRAIDLSRSYPHICAIIVLGGMLGMRRGEIAGMSWKNVDFENSTVYVVDNRVNTRSGVKEKKPKSKAGERVITAGPEAMELLRYIKHIYDEACQEPWFHNKGYVLCKDNGDPYAPDSITQLWERFIEKHNLKKIRLHDLRHTNATLMIANGISPAVVSQRLGHSDTSITFKHYVHVLPEMDQEAADTLDRVFFD